MTTSSITGRHHVPALATQTRWIFAAALGNQQTHESLDRRSAPSPQMMTSSDGSQHGLHHAPLERVGSDDALATGSSGVGHADDLMQQIANFRSGRLHVTVLRARNLLLDKKSRAPDPYVSIKLDKQRVIRFILLLF